MDVIFVPTGGGEVLAVPVPIRILEDGSNTAHRLGFIEARLPPGSGKPPQHMHREHSETFYVMSGTVRFTSADTEVDVPAGGLVTAPVGPPHSFSNPDADEWATFIWAVARALYSGYSRERADLQSQGDKVDENAIPEVRARYGTEPYRPAAP